MRADGKRWRDRRPQSDHRITRQGDEYACKCGVRWPVIDGEQHP